MSDYTTDEEEQKRFNDMPGIKTTLESKRETKHKASELEERMRLNWDLRHDHDDETDDC